MSTGVVKECSVKTAKGVLILPVAEREREGPEWVG